MTEYIAKQDKNGKRRYYRVENGKKTAVKKAEYEVNTAMSDIEPTETTNRQFRQSRWTKVHARGQGNFESKKNVMDITVGVDRAQADILYNTHIVRTFEKAAYWLLHSLEVARANEIVETVRESVQEKAALTSKGADLMTAEGNGWICTIENMGDGEFKAQLMWSFKIEDNYV